MSVTCNRCEQVVDSKLGLVMHFWLVHNLSIEEARKETDSKWYGGGDSGCEQASAYLGYPSRCDGGCPFKSCVYDRHKARARQRNREIRKQYRRGGAIADIAVIYRVTPRTVQRIVKDLRGAKANA